MILIAATASAQTAVQAAPRATPPPAPSIWEGAFTIGASGTSTTDDPGRAGEYQLLKDKGLPVLGAQFWGANGGFRFDVTAINKGDSRNQFYSADLDFNRFVKAHVSYLRMPHRLDHDPMGYIDSVSTLGGTFAVKSTDTDPTAIYGTTNGNFDARLDVTLPTKFPVNLFVSHQRQERSGFHQVMTTNHCATCHVTSYTRKTDELNKFFTAGANLQAGALTLNYAYETRDFKDDVPGVLHQYNNAVHPASLLDVFLNRVQYDDAAGLLPIWTVPGLEKDTHTLRAALALPNDASIVGNYTQTTSRNTEQGLETDYAGFNGRLVVPWKDKVVFKADLKRYDIDSDDAFVDVVELVAPAGPSAGLTYRQAFPSMGNPDFVRESSLSRTPTELNLELAYQPVKKTWIRFGYQWEEVKRKAFEVHKTTTNTFLVRGRSQMGKTANYRVRFQYDAISDPFTYERAAIPQVLQPFMSPGNVPFTGLQYFTMYESRQGDLTSFPTRSLRFDNTLTWTPRAGVAVTAHYNYRDSKNDDLNYSTWGRTAHSPGVDLWVAPDERWTLSAGYSYQRERLETLFSTLAFVG
jgi:hypothetical protein